MHENVEIEFRVLFVDKMQRLHYICQEKTNNDFPNCLRIQRKIMKKVLHCIIYLLAICLQNLYTM